MRSLIDMLNVLKFWFGLRSDEGQDLAEYGLIIALIAVVCIAALTTLGTNLTDILGQLSAKL
jgi:pilus assembly protein Flp/PilA